MAKGTVVKDPLRGFTKRWLRTAFWHSVGPIDLYSGLGGAVITALAHLLPKWEQELNNLVWQIPLWAAGAVVLVRLILAPYWMAKEDAAKIADLEKRGEADNRRIAIKERLGDALSEGHALMGECATTADAADLERRMNAMLTRTVLFINEALGGGEGHLFASGSGLLTYTSTNRPNENLRTGMDIKMQRLVQILKRVDTAPINPSFDPSKAAEADLVRLLTSP